MHSLYMCGELHHICTELVCSGNQDLTEAETEAEKLPWNKKTRFIRRLLALSHFQVLAYLLSVKRFYSLLPCSTALRFVLTAGCTSHLCELWEKHNVMQRDVGQEKTASVVDSKYSDKINFTDWITLLFLEAGTFSYSSVRSNYQEISHLRCICQTCWRAVLRI